MFDLILEAIEKLRRNLKGRGIRVLTVPPKNNKVVEAVAFNADRGFWRVLRKGAACHGLNDGYGAVIVLQLIAKLFVKRSLRASYRAKASCNEGDVFKFEKGQALAKARVRQKMYEKQLYFIGDLREKLADLFDVVDDEYYNLYERSCQTDDEVDKLLIELHEPQGE